MQPTTVVTRRNTHNLTSVMGNTTLLNLRLVGTPTLAGMNRDELRELGAVQQVVMVLENHGKTDGAEEIIRAACHAMQDLVANNRKTAHTSSIHALVILHRP